MMLCLQRNGLEISASDIYEDWYIGVRMMRSEESILEK